MMDLLRQVLVWVPFLILIAGMGFFLSRNRRFYAQLNAQNRAVQQETNRQLQRIADALEKRP